MQVRVGMGLGLGVEVEVLWEGEPKNDVTVDKVSNELGRLNSQDSKSFKQQNCSAPEWLRLE
mgnify:CR=1 FL=1